MAGIAERVGKYRERMREAGLRPVQIWVPDTRQEGFAERCRQQSLALQNDPLEQATLAAIEAGADTDDWR